MISATAAKGTDTFPSGSWSLGPVNVSWSMKGDNEIDVDVTVLGIDIDTLTGTIGPKSTELKDTINLLGVITGSLGVKAVYGTADNTNGLYLEGQLTGPHFDTGALDVRIIPW